MMSIQYKIIFGLFVIIAMYQGSKWAWGSIAESYFEYRCESDAGEFIYKTVDNVEGLYQMRLREPEDYFDRLRHGDYPEDPFGHTNLESQRPWHLFVDSPDKRFRYLETVKEPDLSVYEFNLDYLKFAKKPIFTGEKYWIYRAQAKYIYKTLSGDEISLYAEQSSILKSKYGFTWKEVRGVWDRLFSVWGGELLVKELKTNETLAVRRGYLFKDKFSGGSGMCPNDKNGNISYYFIKKVLKPKTTDSEGKINSGRVNNK